MINVGSISRSIIGDEYLNLPYEKQPIKESEVQRWRDMGYNHNSFTGAMYSSKNPVPSWTDDIADKLDLKNAGFVFYVMQTNDIMPPHEDHFETYCKVFNVSRENVFRAIVFLEDWHPGHYFEYEGYGLVNWRKGDYVMYSYDVEHAASNIGTKPRYTLQVTGTK